MDKFYQNLIDSLDDLMISLCKQKHIGLDPEVNNALKKVTRTRRDYKRALNLRLLANKKSNDRSKLQA